jgi:hypothetical protein
MGENKTSNMHDTLVAIAFATKVKPISEEQREAIELRGD